MSNQEFEIYLKLMGKLLQLNQAQQDLIGVELRDHLESRMADLEEAGVSTEEAFSRALEEFGDAAAMARNFQYVTQLKRRRWMMRLITFSTAGVFLMFLLALAMWPENSHFGAPEKSMAKQDSEDSKVKHTDTDPFGADGNEAGTSSSKPELAKSIIDQNEEIERILKHVTEFDFQETPWSEVRQQLEDKFKINFVTCRSARDDQLSDEEPITFKMNHSLEVCLKELLPTKNATFTVKDGTIRVISLDIAEDPKFLTTRIFDCRSLIAALELQSSSYTRKAESQTSAGADAGASEISNPQAVPFASKQALLVHLITTAVDCQKWYDNGGPFSIEVANGYLMVTSNRETHQGVDLLLKTMQKNILAEK